MEPINILDDILSKSKGYEVALLTTFNFEIPFFERNILYRLESNNVRYFSLFVDSNNYIEAINSITNSSIGKKYVVSEVETRASFHPKLILLLGEKKARLIVSSANLTFTGYCYNNEIFNVFDYDEKNNEYLSLIKDAYYYFGVLNKLYNKLDKTIFEKSEEYNYLHRLAPETNVKFISNYNQSIIEQISDLNLNVKQIDVAVPFYDNELNALKGIKERFNNATVNLYVQNRFSTFNFDYNNKNKIVSDNNIKIFDSFAEIGTSAIYHGKVIRFLTDNESYILYGSANCTEAALFKSSENNGNFECDVLAKGTIDEFDYFFKNFVEVENREEVSNRILSYSSSKQYNFKHIPSEDKDKLLIKYKDKWEDLHIFINDKEYKYEYNEDLLIIELDEDIPYGLFSIDFISKNEKETINGYLVLTNVINEYRTSTNKDLSVTLDKINNSTSIDYIRYYKMLLDLVPYDTDSLKEYKDINDVYKEAKAQKESDDDFDEEFTVDFDIPDEVLNKQREFAKTESIKQSLVSSFVSKINSGLIKRKRSGNGNPDLGHNDGERKYIRSEESKFLSYIRRLFKGAVDKDYLNNINVDKYINNVFLLLNVLYTYNFENEDDFDEKEFVYLTIDFLDSLLNFDLSTVDLEKVETLKTVLFLSLIQCCYYNNSNDNAGVKAVANNRRILLGYDKLYNLRNNYDDYINRSLDISREEMSYDECKRFIEDLFGYMKEDDLKRFVLDRITGNVNISVNNNVYIIEVGTDLISNYMNPSNLLGIMKEIKNRCLQTNEVESLIITFNKTNIDLTSQNPIEFIRYIYSFKSNKLIKQYKNKNDLEFRNITEERV